MQTDTNPQMEKLLRRRAVIDATLNRIQARKRSDSRKKDTRRKILIGAVIMQEMKNDPLNFGAWVNNLLSERLTKSRDRDLFNFPTITPE